MFQGFTASDMIEREVKGEGVALLIMENVTAALGHTGGFVQLRWYG